MATQSQPKVSSDRLMKPGIEAARPGLSLITVAPHSPLSRLEKICFYKSKKRRLLKCFKVVVLTTLTP